MTADVSRLQVRLVTLAGWVNRHQQRVIEYLIEENCVLKGQLKGRRLRLTDDQRRRLAAKGRRLDRRVLRQVATIVTPDTILILCPAGATGRGELRRRGRTEPFRCTEIPDDEKPRIIDAYLARWGYQVRPYFRALPNASDHPVFRIERL
jgi:hypothetical protein